VPLEAVNKILFSKNKLTIEDFLDENGSHRILVSVVEGHEKDIYDRLVPENIDLLMSGIGKFLRKKSLSDNNFLGTFLSYCTGQSFIPDLGCPESSFKVTVEFNFSEMDKDSWPVAHTCDNVLKLPGTAYDGNAETFASKLEKAMAYSAEASFSME
jgi:hypothetical protein